MYLLRRTAARAVASTPSKALFAKPRSITTYTPAAFRPHKQQWIASSFQRRFASDEVVKDESKAPEEEFAQTAAEAPVDENVTPAAQPEAQQAEPTDAAKTTSIEELEVATAKATEGGASPTSTSVPKDQRVLYVGNLFYEVTEDQLKRVFSRFGPVTKTTVVYDARGLSRGFAYVEYENQSDAKAAIDNLDMQVFEGRNLVVQYHKPKNNPNRRQATSDHPIQPPSKTLFIGNMSFEMSDKDLNDLFRDIRNVLDVRVAIDRRTGQPRGFAHADFIDVASATKAKATLADKVIYGRKLRVDFGRSGMVQQRRDSSAQ